MESNISSGSNIPEYPIVTDSSRRRQSEDYLRSLSRSKDGGRPGVSETLRKGTKVFFGLDDGNDVESDEEKRKVWTNRRLRLASRSYGGLKDDYFDVPDGTETFPARKKPSVSNYTLNGLITLKRKIRKPKVNDAGVRSKSFSFKDVEKVVEARGDDEKSEVSFGGGPKPKQSRDDDETDYPGTFPSPMDDSDDKRRVYGVGAVGELMGRSLKYSRQTTGLFREMKDEMEDYRPYFTYWITTVQVLVLIVSVALYGIGNFDFFLSQKTGLVLTKSLTLEQVSVSEPGNFWLGPRPADLIRLGAKFTPCMRSDESISRKIEEDRRAENENSGCCVRNDDSGCVQTTEDECSPLLSTFYKWSKDDNNSSRKFGPVCGLDPRYCEVPAPLAPSNAWPDDLRGWPICLKEREIGLGDPPHLTCEIIAKPCCVGIHGKCELHTEEYCDWVRGTFHREAHLCSQVSCMQDVCGMLPFIFDENVPDQFYRLWSSLFLHAGIIHLAITLFVQLAFMRDLEKMCGPLRIAIIYFGSGIIGNLASAVFVPYRAESGPSGAHFGLIASHVIEVLDAWSILRSPKMALLKLLSLTLLLFLTGFLPWVDNYAHIFGFIAGLMLSYAVMPYLKSVVEKRLVFILLCLGSSLGLTLILLIVFYVVPFYDCEICRYLSCIPFTPDFCAVQNINLVRDKPILK